MVIELPTERGGVQLQRLFSVRGIARLCMLLKSEPAARFRDWAEQVLTTTQAPPTPAPAPQAVEALLTPEARRVLRYRRLGLETQEIVRLIGRAPSTVRKISARLRAAGLLGSPASLPAVTHQSAGGSPAHG